VDCFAENENLGIKCRGCVQQKGKPLWIAMIKIEGCPLYICCVDKKHIEHCGLCAEFPCRTFNEMRDPSLDDEVAQKALVARRNELIERKQIGTQKWLRKKMA